MKTFHSKILLFGEYGLLHGSMGLAIPYSKYSGHLCWPDEDAVLSRQQLDSNSVVKKLAIDLSHKDRFMAKPKLANLLEDALLGLYFDSNIPKSYGIGSSGTLVAAIFDHYFATQQSASLSHENLKNLQGELAHMESYFHGKSSGTDPLVSFLNRATLLNAPSNHFEFEIPDSLVLFLIDTQHPSATKNFVELFNSKGQQNRQGVKSFIEQNNHCISAFLENQNQVFSLIQEFCLLEQQLLPEMFLLSDSLKSLLLENESRLCVKLSGSGGGGFLLGFAVPEHFSDLAQQFEAQHIPIEIVSPPTQALINI